MLSLDWNLVFTVINIVILFLLLKRFLFKPVNEIMAQREKLIQSRFQEAEEKVKEAQELEKQYQESISSLEAKSEAMMKESREKAQEEYDEIIHAAREKAVEIQKRADEAAKEEKEKAVREVQNQIAELAIAAAAQIAATQASEMKDGKLFDDFLTKVGEKS